jgi:predicted nucleic acid-binding protein
MKRIIVDASRVGNAVLPDEHIHFTENLLAVLAESDLIEPSHWPIEIANLVVKASRRERLSIPERNEAREAIAVLISAAEIESVSQPIAALDLAVSHNISVYDAGYLELALRTGLPLLTSDGALSNAAARCGVELVSVE